ncbi:MAG: hypothetical protein HQL69_09115 [Magnetococcales bacterium]|nr:hypothetical protein [Magnetococcales bacterium]
MNFLASDIVEELQDENKRTCNGFLVLVDIKNSTDRKKNYPVKWVLHNKAVYKSFTNFANKVRKEVPKLEDQDFTMPVKFIGDAGMAFFRYSDTKSEEENKRVDSDTASQLLDLLLAFRNEIHDANDLLELRLKTVITYLTDVFVYDDDEAKVKDILGRGIDFCFRLEKFADPTHIVMNKMFKNSIDEHEKGLYKGYSLLECKKKIKGWTKNTDGEIFYIMTSKDMLSSHLILSASNHSDHVTNELINFFKDEVEKKEVTVEKLDVDTGSIDKKEEPWIKDDIVAVNGNLMPSDKKEPTIQVLSKKE